MPFVFYWARITSTFLKSFSVLFTSIIVVIHFFTNKFTLISQVRCVQILQQELYFLFSFLELWTCASCGHWCFDGLKVQASCLMLQQCLAWRWWCLAWRWWCLAWRWWWIRMLFWCTFFWPLWNCKCLYQQMLLWS